MAASQTVEAIPHLARLGNVVPEGYTYYEKLVTAGEDLSLPQAYLKWYDIYAPGAEITAAEGARSRAFLAAEVAAGRLALEGDLGFVLLHRAGPGLLLLVITWRQTNELWESIFVQDAAAAGGYRPLTFANGQWGTYCVWELGPIWHERHAWVRFLSSPRDEAAKLAYVNDRFVGRI